MKTIIHEIQITSARSEKIRKNKQVLFLFSHSTISTQDGRLFLHTPSWQVILQWTQAEFNSDTAYPETASDHR
jgi:hypothetical protein